jgi:hypothetical protein
MYGLRLMSLILLLAPAAACACSLSAPGDETVLLSPKVVGTLAEYQRAGKLCLIFDPFAAIFETNTLEQLGLEEIDPKDYHIKICTWRRQLTIAGLNRIASAQGVAVVRPCEH